jgi:hypothetical protein
MQTSRQILNTIQSHDGHERWSRVYKLPKKAVVFSFTVWIFPQGFTHNPTSWRRREMKRRGLPPNKSVVFSFTVWISRQVLYTIQPHALDEKGSTAPSLSKKSVVVFLTVQIFPPDFTRNPAPWCAREMKRRAYSLPINLSSFLIQFEFLARFYTQSNLTP